MLVELAGIHLPLRTFMTIHACMCKSMTASRFSRRITNAMTWWSSVSSIRKPCSARRATSAWTVSSTPWRACGGNIRCSNRMDCCPSRFTPLGPGSWTNSRACWPPRRDARRSFIISTAQYILEVPRGTNPPTRQRSGDVRAGNRAGDRNRSAHRRLAVSLPLLLEPSRKIIPSSFSILAILSVAGVALAQWTGGSAAAETTSAPSEGHFFFLGLGFLLLETQSIGDCSLYFGVTWLVTLIVVCGVLLMVLAANLLAMRLTTPRVAYYLPLLGSVARCCISCRGTGCWRGRGRGDWLGR